ncbi:MAG: hypothetical protein MUC43_10055 [Pirellula sp.]|nr:hypothetical protein [Pirellula sp.]
MLRQYKSFRLVSFGLAMLCALSINSGALGQRPKSSAELLLKTEHGPWMVLAASFEGEGAKRKAVQLAAELREEFRLKAYCLPKMFDYTQTVAGVGFTPQGEQKKMKYQDDRVIESCAVLVGDFDSIEGDDIERTLNYVRTIKPKFYNQGGSASSAGDESKVAAGDYRKWLEKLVVRKEETKIKDPGPMSKAFLVRNPLLPAEYFKSPTVDKFVKDLNQQPVLKEHNLLNCKSNFTVRVLTLKGKTAYVSWGRSAELNEEDSDLEAAAEQAYLVTKVLRDAGYEAYQFHNRQESIVTIGGFDNLGKEQPDKSFQYDPAIQRVVDKFKGTDRVTQSKFGLTQTPRMLVDEVVPQNRIPELAKGTREEQLELFRKLSVAFDLIPLPIAVPKLEAKSLYSGYALGK